MEGLRDYLPFAKTTISETCTLVVATRIKSDEIMIAAHTSEIFSKKYGDNTEVKITFPAGVAEKKLGLTVQVIRADARNTYGANFKVTYLFIYLPKLHICIVIYILLTYLQGPINHRGGP